MTTASPARPGDDARRRKLLEAALSVFARYGFRKTSMDEVARAAQLSRQGLYLHFATKEDLFRATVLHAVESSLHAASLRLVDETRSVEERLVGAFDEWVGRYVGMFGAGVADLAEALDALVGAMVTQYEQLFTDAVARFIRNCGLLAAYKPAGLTARQLADTLHATARGLKHSASRAEFVERFGLAARAFCMPLERS
jgi:AcrR family transcriptional regulator